MNLIIRKNKASELFDNVVIICFANEELSSTGNITNGAITWNL